MKKSFVLGLVLVVLLLSGCKMLTALFGKVTVTFDLNGGHINGSTEKVTRTGDPEDEFLLPQNPFKNAVAVSGYRFDGWRAKESSYNFDYEIGDCQYECTFYKGLAVIFQKSSAPYFCPYSIYTDFLS